MRATFFGIRAVLQAQFGRVYRTIFRAVSVNWKSSFCICTESPFVFRYSTSCPYFLTFSPFGRVRCGNSFGNTQQGTKQHKCIRHDLNTLTQLSIAVMGAFIIKASQHLYSRALLLLLVVICRELCQDADAAEAMVLLENRVLEPKK